jgi:hypothetical protein
VDRGQVWDGPLGVLCLEGPISCFLHPAVLKVLQVPGPCGCSMTYASAYF